MKKWMYYVRYVGSATARRFLIQRNDGRLWTGTGWGGDQSEALLYRYTDEAQRDCRALTRQHVMGEPVRQFTCTFTATVFGEAATVTAGDVADYLRAVLHIGLDYEREADGPLAEMYVEVAVRLGDMKEG
jgi:hypothetical protein